MLKPVSMPPGEEATSAAAVAELAAAGELVASLRDRGLIRRWNSDYEYEMKFRISSDCSDASQLLDAIFPARRLAQFTVDRAHATAVLQPTYYSSPDEELSLFEYDGADLLKRKRHAVLQVAGYPIMKSRELFASEPVAISGLLNRRDVHEVGQLTKARAKHFVIADEVSYSAAVTVCTTGALTQRQFELEYHGHIGPAYPDAVTDDSLCQELI